MDRRILKQKYFVAATVSVVVFAVGGAFFVTTFFSTKAVPVSVRVYTDWNRSGGSVLLRVSAYDSIDRLPVRVDSTSVEAIGVSMVPGQGFPDGTAVTSIPAASLDLLEPIAVNVGTDKGTRRVAILPQGRKGPVAARPSVLPVSAELRIGPSTQLGLGTQGSRDEFHNREALNRLKVVPYPEQGRLAANLPNRVFLWGRGCADGAVEVTSSSGRGRVDLDAAGMGEFAFTPTLGTSWLKVSCGGWGGRAELRDRPQGIAASPAFIISQPGRRISFKANTLFAKRPITMDVFRDCGWIESRNVVPDGGEVAVEYLLPQEPGLYSIELYGNINSAGEGRARVVVLSADDGRAALKTYIRDLQGPEDEPLYAHLLKMLERSGLPPDEETAPATAALFSRVRLDCGPPPLILDTLESDLAALAQTKDRMRSAAFFTLIFVWLLASVLIVVAMALRLHAASRTDPEKRIRNYLRHIVYQHAMALMVITITFGMFYYAAGLFWRI